MEHSAFRVHNADIFSKQADKGESYRNYRVPTDATEGKIMSQNRQIRQKSMDNPDKKGDLDRNVQFYSARRVTDSMPDGFKSSETNELFYGVKP